MAANPSQGKLPVIRIENLGTGQKNVPFTFGQVFKVGALMPGQGLAGQLPNGDLVTLQIDQKATHADGSVRHAIISGVLPTIFEKEERELKLVTAKAGADKPFSLAQIPDGVVELTVDGTKYSTNGSKFGDVIEWLSGGVVAEGIVCAELLDANGKPHPHLTVRAGIRAYSSEHVRVEITVENTKTFTPGASRFIYDVVVKIGGNVLFEQKSLTHYHHARWRKVFWLGGTPEIHIKHDTAYLIDSKAVPNYDQSIVPSVKGTADLVKKARPDSTGPMKIGPVIAYMPTTGGRGDIGPLPNWSAAYLLSMSKDLYGVMIAAAEGSGSWSIHYRDEKTGYPIRVDTEANKKVTTHMNFAHKGPLPVPRFSSEKNSSYTPYSHDTAHQPSLVYLPYLLTGEYYYLEELHFWASSNSLETDPNNSGFGQGLVRWQQVRGQAWSLRTLGHAAYITPDSHPLKDYFVAQVDHNLNFYHAAYVEGNPNKLGAYDGSGASAFQVGASAPWQDDYLTWSFGNLVELGFEKALPILLWKAKYAVGRMTAPGFCWIQASTYDMKFKPSAKAPIFETFKELYDFNFGGSKIWVEGTQKAHPTGLKYIDQPCGSQEQADWMGKTAGYTWKVGQMVGYAGSEIGYPANLQPALSVAATLGAPGADDAWAIFDSRTVKPNYNYSPQFAIVPRAKVVPPSEEEPAPEEKVKVFKSQKPVNGELLVNNEMIEDGKSYTVIVLEE